MKTRAMATTLAMSIVLLAPAGVSASAAEPCPNVDALPANWHAAYPAHRIIGNLYAVGGYDLAAFLITTPAGHILVNTGLADSTRDIRANIERLGFRLEDIRILLTTQAHFDHTAALAEIKDLSGAEMWATAKDARVLADGGASDAHFGHCEAFRFTPVRADRILEDGAVIELGGMRITTHLHPGHTEGSSSYTFTHRENGKSYRVLIANMGTINDGKQLVVEPTYAGVAQDFADTFRRQHALEVDVWVASHASQYHRDSKYRPGQPYDPERFADPRGFKAEVARLEELYTRQVIAERGCRGLDECLALYADPSEWADEIELFAMSDAVVPRPTGAIVATGSSSMRFWGERIKDDLAPLTIIPRGFGGSTMNDVLHHLDALVLQYQPRAVLIYEGDNDIALGISNEAVMNRYQTTISRIHAYDDTIRIYLLAVKPSIDRIHHWPQMQAFNQMLATLCAGDPRLTFLDVATPMLDANGQPKADIFVADELHMNAAGYDLWRDAIRPALLEREGEYEP